MNAADIEATAVPVADSLELCETGPEMAFWCRQGGRKFVTLPESCHVQTVIGIRLRNRLPVRALV
jgi:hypothetical protein